MTVPSIAVSSPAGAAGAPLLVLGPSLGTDSALLWEHAAPALRERFRTVTWDLPGHGHSAPATEAFTVGELADAVAAAARELGAAKICYAGVSLGGATGLELAIRHPDLVQAVAIVASGALIGSPESWAERAAKARAESTSSLIITSAQRWFAPGSVEREPVTTGRLLHSLQDADDESYARCCEALAGYDVRDRLGRVAAPLLALWGEHDQVAPVEKAEELVAGVPNGRIAMVADAAHLPPAEQPAATAAALLDFFAAVA